MNKCENCKYYCKKSWSETGSQPLGYGSYITDYTVTKYYCHVEPKYIELEKDSCACAKFEK